MGGGRLPGSRQRAAAARRNHRGGEGVSARDPPNVPDPPPRDTPPTHPHRATALNWDHRAKPEAGSQTAAPCVPDPRPTSPRP